MEEAFIEWLRKRIAPSGHRPKVGRLPVGIGDDAAVLQLQSSSSLVVATDMLMDGAHVILAECGAARAGHKALGVNLSDLAAMAAEPRAAFISLALPAQDPQKCARDLIEGMLPLAERFGCAIAGGDTNVWNGPLVVNVVVLGETGRRGPLIRSGARPGDWILVTGRCGGSILGRHLDVMPRVEEALLLHDRYELHAGIDISDGLARDLARIATASGCGAAIELDNVPVHDDAHRAAGEAADGRTPLDHALADGEDFELILAVPSEDAERILRDEPLDVPVTRIGEFVSERGLWSVDASGARIPLEATGYEHGSTVRDA